MRRAARTDANQTEIVQGLREIGCTVQSLAAVGDGCPDLLVGRAGATFLIEVKDGSKAPSEQKLTKDQIKFHADWRGHVSVARTLEEAIRIVKPRTLQPHHKADLELAVKQVLDAGLSTGHADTCSDLMLEVLGQINEKRFTQWEEPK